MATLIFSLKCGEASDFTNEASPASSNENKKSLSVNFYRIQTRLLEWHSHCNSCLYVDPRISNMKNVAGFPLTIILKNKRNQNKTTVFCLLISQKVLWIVLNMTKNLFTYVWIFTLFTFGDASVTVDLAKFNCELLIISLGHLNIK